MIDRDTQYEIEKAQRLAQSLWEQLEKALKGKDVVLGETDVFVQAQRFDAFYNGLFCLQADLRDLLQKHDQAHAAHTGENILDFTTEAPKHRGKNTPERKKPL